MPVLSVAFFPLDATMKQLDPVETELTMTLVEARSRVSNISKATIAGLTQGSRFRGLGEPQVEPVVLRHVE